MKRQSSPLSQSQAANIVTPTKSFFAKLTDVVVSAAGFTAPTLTTISELPPAPVAAVPAAPVAVSSAPTLTTRDKGKAKVKWGANTIVHPQAPDNDVEVDDVLRGLKEIPGEDNFHQDLRDVEEAVNLLGVNEDTWESNLQAGRISLSQKDYAKAQMFFDKVFNFEPKSVYLQDTLAKDFLTLGSEHLARKDFEKAEECFAKSVDLQPDNVEILPTLVKDYIALGVEYLGKKDKNNAKQCFIRAVNWQPKNADIPTDIAKYYIQEIQFSQNTSSIQFAYGEVKVLLQAALELDSNHPTANFMLGKIYYEGGGSVERATPYLEKTVAADPSDSEARLMLAKIHYKRGEEVDQKRNEESDTHRREELDKEIANKFSKAEQLFKEVTLLDPKNIEAQFLLGKIYFTRQDLNLAEVCFKKVLDLDPRHKEASLCAVTLADLKGNLSKIQHNLVEAWEEYDRAVKAAELAILHNPSDEQLKKTKQDLLFRWGELGVDNVFEQLEQDVWMSITTLGVAGNHGITEAILREKGQEPFKQYGNNTNGKNKFGQTPLHVCIGSLQLVRRLVEEYHADINTPDINGDTPIMVAAASGQTAVVGFLLAQGAELQRTNNHGNNIFQVIVRSHNPKINNSLDFREITIVLIGHLRNLDRGKTPTELILSEGVEKEKVTGTNLLLHLLTDANKAKQNVRELAKAEKKPDLLQIFEQAIELIMNERITGMFEQGFSFQEIAGENKVAYAAEIHPEETTRTFLRYTTFLQRYLPLFPDSAFNPRALCTPYRQYFNDQATFLFIMKKFQQANECIVRGLQEEAPELTKDMFTASNAIASLVNLVCNQGFIYLSFEATLRAATVLQARHQPSPQNPSLSFVEPHDQFWVLIPQVVQDNHLELMGKVYQRIYKKRIQDVIEFHGRPKIGEPQAPASSWGLMSLVQGLVSYVSPAVESLRQVDFHMSGSLLSALFQVLKASDIEIYQEATEAVRKKTEEFLSIIDNEIDKSIQLNGKTSKNDKMVETTEILMELFNILDGDSKEEDKLEELEAFLNQTKNKSALLVNHIDSQMQARELLGRYQDANPEGSAFKKLPLSTMLQVIKTSACESIFRRA